MCLPFCHKWKLIEKCERTIDYIDTGERNFKRYIILQCTKCGIIKKKEIE